MTKSCARSANPIDDDDGGGGCGGGGGGDGGGGGGDDDGVVMRALRQPAQVARAAAHIT